MTCRSCESHKLTEVMDFGRVALAGAFLLPEQFAVERKYPLRLAFCEKCFLLQVMDPVEPSVMFSDYFYHSSATQTMSRHFSEYARALVDRFHPSRALEIGCNDGVLLRPLEALGVNVTGVDPARNVTNSSNVINAFWGSAVGKLLGKFDLILANNVFAHMPNINDACAGVARSLTENGSFVFEVNRLDSLVADLQYDWVYHEHVYYYSLLALWELLKRHGLQIYDVQRLPTHAGSMRVYACHKGKRLIATEVQSQMAREQWSKLDRVERFHEFATNARLHATDLARTVKEAGKVIGYGACGRTNTLLQYAGLDHTDITSIVDDARAKQGYYTPGTHIPIVGSLEDADLLVVFAWSFFHEIAPKLGGFRGRVITPLPEIHEHRRAA